MEYRKIKEICEKYRAEYFENVCLAAYTSFKIGGECPIMLCPNNIDCLKELVSEFWAKKIEFKVLGKGSNLLISDNGVNCPVISLTSMNKATVKDEKIFCDSGASLIGLCTLAAEHALSGLEFAYGIPGSAGGAVYMNAGAYGGEMKDVISKCTYVNMEGNLVSIDSSEMDFSYRHSYFSGKKLIIAEIELDLNKADKNVILKKMHEHMNARKEKQPLEYPSAGSTFKRPKGDFAGRLIENAGLRGFSVGGAQVSEKHCGFIVNKGGASFDDVKALIKIVKERVEKSSGILLEPEIVIWDT